MDRELKHGVSLAFHTIVSTGLLVEQLSFAFPAALLLWQRRSARFLPQQSRYNMGAVGWVVNSTVVAWTCLVLVMYSFPTEQPVTAQNMSKRIIEHLSSLYSLKVDEADTCLLDLVDYNCVVLVGMGLLTMANWVFYARSHYRGPSMTLAVGS